MGLQIWIAFLAGIALGALISELIWNFQSARGTLKIDTNNPEKDVYRIDIDNLDVLSKKKRLVCNIEKGVDLSQQ